MILSVSHPWFIFYFVLLILCCHTWIIEKLSCVISFFKCVFGSNPKYLAYIEWSSIFDVIQIQYKSKNNHMSLNVLLSTFEETMDRRFARRKI